MGATMRGSDRDSFSKATETQLILRSCRLVVLALALLIMLTADDGRWVFIVVSVGAYAIDAALRGLQIEVELAGELCMSARDCRGVLHACVLPLKHAGGHRYCCIDEGSEHESDDTSAAR